MGIKQKKRPQLSRRRRRPTELTFLNAILPFPLSSSCRAFFFLCPTCPSIACLSLLSFSPGERKKRAADDGPHGLTLSWGTKKNLAGTPHTTLPHTFFCVQPILVDRHDYVASIAAFLQQNGLLTPHSPHKKRAGAIFHLTKRRLKNFPFARREKGKRRIHLLIAPSPFQFTLNLPRNFRPLLLHHTRSHHGLHFPILRSPPLSPAQKKEGT